MEKYLHGKISSLSMATTNCAIIQAGSLVAVGRIGDQIIQANIR
jgi:hypothetical protein